MNRPLVRFAAVSIDKTRFFDLIEHVRAGRGVDRQGFGQLRDLDTRGGGYFMDHPQFRTAQAAGFFKPFRVSLNRLEQNSHLLNDGLFLFNSVAHVVLPM